MQLRSTLTGLLLGVSLLAQAQDTRVVTEPKVPPVCAVLRAQLVSQNGALADADETKLDTQRIQKAIDACKPGSAVELRAEGDRNAFLSAPLELKSGITLLVSKGSTLFASRNPRDYDITPGTCGTITDRKAGCKPLIRLAKAPNAAIMGDGVIDGRGGANPLGQSVSWWTLARQAQVTKQYQNVPRILVADQADGLILYRITLRNSPNFHVIVQRTNGFTVWGVKIDTPARARNTDGIDPSSSTNVSILHSYIRTGDDNVAIKAGSSGPATHMTIAHNHFYSGHGMSIGSETNGGASAIEVHDLTIDGADNGLRIKSNPARGGLVQNVVYDDVCIRNVKNPIVLETAYEGKTEGTLIPVFEKIRFHNVRIAGGGRIKVVGLEGHPLQMTFDGVRVSGIPAQNILFHHARVVTGEVNFAVTGDDVQSTKAPHTAKVSDCGPDRFVPFPSEP